MLISSTLSLRERVRLRAFRQIIVCLIHETLYALTTCRSPFGKGEQFAELLLKYKFGLSPKNVLFAPGESNPSIRSPGFFIW
jgi:hypothetical protein